jgi:hypothetical protein
MTLPPAIGLALAAALVPAGCELAGAADDVRPPDEVRIEVGEVDALPGWTEELRGEVAGLPELFARWRTLHPGAPLPDVRFVAGRGEGDAALLDGRVVVDLEALSSPASLAPAVARELGRAAQRPPLLLPVGIPGVAAKETRLVAAIRDGSADLVAVLVTGQLPDPELHRWARPLERELWDRFREAADGRPGRPWLDERILDEPPPGDAARFLGYRIVESLWARSANRPQALREILSVRDFDDLLERSGYEGSGPSEAEPPSLAGFEVGTWPGFECVRVPVGETRLHACTAGEGPVPVVLDAPAGLDHRSWHGIAPELARAARVVVYDRAGTGRSEPGPEPRTPAREAHELAALLEVVAGLGPYLLVEGIASDAAAERSGTAAPGAVPGPLTELAALYPWRNGATLAVPSGTDPNPREVARTIAGTAERLSNAPPPGAAGEPFGCWRVQGRGNTPLLRLAFLPGGAGGVSDRAAHPVVAVPSGAELGHWRPLDPGTLELVLAPDGWSVLRRGGDGRWTAPDGSVSLLPRPCEIPD